MGKKYNTRKNIRNYICNMRFVDEIIEDEKKRLEDLENNYNISKYNISNGNMFYRLKNNSIEIGDNICKYKLCKDENFIYKLDKYKLKEKFITINNNNFLYNLLLSDKDSHLYKVLINFISGDFKGFFIDKGNKAYLDSITLNFQNNNIIFGRGKNNYGEYIIEGKYTLFTKKEQYKKYNKNKYLKNSLIKFGEFSMNRKYIKHN